MHASRKAKAVFCICAIGALTVATVAWAARAKAEASAASARWDFDKDVIGQLPQAWSARQTRPTNALATWQVVKDSTAPSQPNVLALTKTENHNGTYNLAVAEKSNFKDIDLTVKMKGVRGEEDQGGGPIWRCRDEDNYYICRANPLENNYRLYRVVGGRRRQLDSVEVPVATGRWYTLRVTMVGSRITCYLDGRSMLEATDDTFPQAGMIGLWTKADAVTSFDDLTVTPK